MQYSMKTDKGFVRDINQDNCFLTVFNENCCFAVVCDGMGGPNAGDIASEIAIKNISERFVAGWRRNISLASVKNLLTTAISAANICIFDAAAENKDYAGMGTTCVAAVCLDDSIVIAHIGDSRAYLINSEIKQLTKDHSLVQELVDKGEISEIDAETFPYKNVITRALGINEHVDIDFSEFNLTDSDKILLCSDGLTNFVKENKICEIIKSHSIKDVASVLIAEANSNGGGDNVTAVVFSK